MKTFYLLALALILCCNNALAQCPPNDFFGSQQDIDDFALNYPNCTEVSNLSIGSWGYVSTDITNLDGFSNLTSIFGGLSINQNNSLIDLTGLNNLNTIGGQLMIANNDNLASLTGLENLNSIGGDLTIGLIESDYSGIYEYNGNPSLNNLAGLNGLSSLGGNLSITANGGLTSLSGLNNLDTIWGELHIKYNNALGSFSGLDSLTHIDNGFYLGRTQKVPYSSNYYCDFYNAFEGNSSLIDFTGLGQLNSIGGEFQVVANSSLENFSGLNNLSSIGTFTVYGNHALINFTGLENLETVGIIYIEGSIPLYDYDYWGYCYEYDSPLGNNGLSSLSGLENLTANSFSISHNPSLSICNIPSMCNFIQNGSANSIHDNATGCNDANEIALSCNIITQCPFSGEVNFFSQAQVDNFINDYPDCTQINEVIIRDNVSNLNGLQEITSINQLIIKNSNLNNLEGLSSLRSVTDIFIWGNNSLEDLSGLDSLRTIQQHLVIGDNNTLVSLTGLNSLDSIGGTLAIGSREQIGNLIYNLPGNASLQNLTGLENLDYIGQDLFITGDDYYSYFPVGNLSLQNLTGLQSLNYIGGSVDITDNDNLTNIEGLESLDLIGEDMTIYYNDNLISLTGLGSLDFVGGDVRISYNDNLISLADVNSIAGATSLEIRSNDNLSICAIPAICDYLLNGGPSDIAWNDPGCLSVTNILNYCTVDTETPKTDDVYLELYPNPANTYLNIGCYSDKPITLNLDIMSNTGQVVLSHIVSTQEGQNIIPLNIEHLSAGYYYLRTYGENSLPQTQPFVKINP